MKAETEAVVEEIGKSLELLRQRLDWDTAAHRLEELNARAEDPRLWDDPAHAQKVMRDRQRLADAVEGYRTLERALDENVELIELGEAEGDKEIVAEAEAALGKLHDEAAAKEVEALLSGEVDGNDTFLEVHSGAGGTESCDWAAMLARMYVRWAEAHGYKVELMSETPGEEAGIKSATYQIKGGNAYGWLKTESGVHRLVRNLALRQPGAPPHLVLVGLGLPGDRRYHRDRDPRQGHPAGYLPVIGRRRSACQQDQLGGAHHASADRDRGHVFREVSAPEPRERLGSPAGAPL